MAIAQHSEIKDIDDARSRIATVFGKAHKEYAEMALFLTNQDQVKKSLVEVSAGIWDAYRAIKFENTPNRFTRAIVRYAEQFGFVCQNNVVFTGPLTSQDFLEQVKTKVLWKDTFAPEHGEFSHTFQWLAAGLHFGWMTGTAELYKESANIWNVEKVSTRNPKNASAQVLADEKTIPLWAWLVDCFPVPDAPPGQVDATCNIFSNTCRTPNVIWKLAKSLPEDAFIGYYVKHRQWRLNKAAVEGKKSEFYEHPVGATTSKIQDIQAIKSYTSARYEAKTKDKEWKGVGDTSTFETVKQVPVEGKPFTRPVRSSQKTTHRVFSRPTTYTEDIQKKLLEKTFHNKTGLVPETVLTQQITV